MLLAIESVPLEEADKLAIEEATHILVNCMIAVVFLLRVWAYTGFFPPGFVLRQV